MLLMKATCVWALAAADDDDVLLQAYVPDAYRRLVDGAEAPERLG